MDIYPKQVVTNSLKQNSIGINSVQTIELSPNAEICHTKLNTE